MSDASPSPRRKRSPAGRNDESIRIDPASGQPSRAETRRRKIFRSLHDCIIENGYSKTTLADIAKKAGMSPSHLLYYFQGKERILEEYFDSVAGWFLKRVADIAEEAPEVRIRALCDLWFGEGEAAYDDIGFMLECFGEAVHDGEMRHTKSEFDRACKSYLVSLFPDHDASIGVSAEDASEISYALLIGLRNSVYFDRSMSPGDAARCFQEAVDRLRGI
ncbi:MAG: TetR/AcrR family transcriptional regulator [Pseudomonadota bacterium]